MTLQGKGWTQEEIHGIYNVYQQMENLTQSKTVGALLVLALEVRGLGRTLATKGPGGAGESSESGPTTIQGGFNR